MTLHIRYKAMGTQVIVSPLAGKPQTATIRGVTFRIVPQERYAIRDDWSETVYARAHNYRQACLLAEHYRDNHDDDTIGVVDSRTGRFITEVIK